MRWLLLEVRLRGPITGILSLRMAPRALVTERGRRRSSRSSSDSIPTGPLLSPYSIRASLSLHGSGAPSQSADAAVDSAVVVVVAGSPYSARRELGEVGSTASSLSLRDTGEIWARCGRDMGEMWARCGRDRVSPNAKPNPSPHLSIAPSGRRARSAASAASSARSASPSA